MAKPKITVNPGDEPQGPEIMEAAIVELAAGMKRLNSTRLKTETIVTLISDVSRVPKTTVRLVLNNLDDLESTFLKPKKNARA